MPVPKPNKGEKQDEFIARFMGNETMKKEFPDEKQRLAVAYSTWRKSKQMDLKFSYQVPIIESAFINNDFIITGTAINATLTSNNHKFVAEELKKSASTLNGVPLLVDHKNEVSSIKGRVINGDYNEEGPRVDFRAHVIDQITKEMIKDGRINSVSVGATVKELEESEDGFFIPRGIEFKELSLVAVPADSGATFTIALKEAYEMAVGTEEPLIESFDDADQVMKAMKKFTKTKFKSKEERNEERARILRSAKKYKMDTTDFEKETSAQIEQLNHNQLNQTGGKIMESEDITKTETQFEDKGVTAESLQKMIKSEVTEALKSVKSELIEAIKSVKEDETEKPIEPTDKPTDETEGGDEGEIEGEDEVAEEKGKYKIVEGHGTLRGGSFTLVRY